MNNFSADFAAKDFSAKAVRRLAKLGITVIGIQMCPDMTSDLPWANATKCYAVNDNDCGRVWSFSQVVAAAAAA